MHHAPHFIMCNNRPWLNNFQINPAKCALSRINSENLLRISQQMSNTSVNNVEQSCRRFSRALMMPERVRKNNKVLYVEQRMQFPIFSAHVHFRHMPFYETTFRANYLWTRALWENKNWNLIRALCAIPSARLCNRLFSYLIALSSGWRRV